MLFEKKVEPLLLYSVGLKIGLGDIALWSRKIGYSFGVLAWNHVREQWVFSWMMKIILDKWLKPWILSWLSPDSQMPPRCLVKWWYLSQRMASEPSEIMWRGLLILKGWCMSRVLSSLNFSGDPARWEMWRCVSQSAPPPSLLAVVFVGKPGRREEEMFQM